MQSKLLAVREYREYVREHICLYIAREIKLSRQSLGLFGFFFLGVYGLPAAFCDQCADRGYHHEQYEFRQEAVLKEMQEQLVIVDKRRVNDVPEICAFRKLQHRAAGKLDHVQIHPCDRAGNAVPAGKQVSYHCQPRDI